MNASGCSLKARKSLTESKILKKSITFIHILFLLIRRRPTLPIYSRVVFISALIPLLPMTLFQYLNFPIVLQLLKLSSLVQLWFSHPCCSFKFPTPIKTFEFYANMTELTAATSTKIIIFLVYMLFFISLKDDKN